MTDAYAASGVDTSAADRGVAALVGVLRTIETGASSRVVPLPGHFAAVLRVAPNLGIAVGTDGVGSKLLVAEATGRLDTVGIDCVAMNVNDLVCVGAEPIALLDYLAVEQTDPGVFEAIARGLKTGAEQAGVEIPGGEVAVLPELIRGHPSPHGFDLTAACFGTVALDAIVTGADCAPGDALIGLPSSGLHSNGYSLARSALADVPLDGSPISASPGAIASPVTIASSATVPKHAPVRSKPCGDGWPLISSGSCASSPPGISTPASSAPRFSPSAMSRSTPGSACSTAR